MSLMAKKKPTVPKPKRKGTPIHVWISPELRAALERAADKNRRYLKAEVELALEDYLMRQGVWPPTPNGP